MNSALLWLAAGAMTLTAAVHSILGERRLIRPMLALDQGVLSVPLARQVVRFAWHITSALMIACAAALVVAGTPRPLLNIIGAIWLGFGLFDLVYTRAKHIGWPLLAAAGAFALLGANV